MKGTVVRILEEKSFGFIKNMNGDYFFHRQDFNGHWDDLIEDFNRKIEINVEFEGIKTDKGLRAKNVSRNDWPNQSGG